jgi:hypothetical protein
MRMAWGIFLMPELSGGIGLEMRALGSSPFWSKTVVCVPPHHATEAPARWEATVERGRSIGLELPSYDPRGFVYAPRRDLSVAIGANGPRRFILGEQLEHIDEMVDDLVEGLQGSSVALKTALPVLFEYERADARATGTISLELLLGDFGTRLLRTACELCVQLEGRTVSVDHLRHAANVPHVSPDALQLELTALQDVRAVKLPRTPAYSLTVTTAGFEWFAQRHFPGYAALRGRFVMLIKASPKLGSNDVAEELQIPVRYADHLFEQLEAEGMVKTRISARGEVYLRPGPSRLWTRLSRFWRTWM